MVIAPVDVAARPYLHDRPESISIRQSAFQLDLQPVTLPHRVFVQRRNLRNIGYQQIQVAVVIIVENSQAAGCRAIGQANVLRDLFESEPRCLHRIAKEHVGIVREEKARRHEEVFVAVIFEIKKLRAPSPSRQGDTGFYGAVHEIILARVEEQRVYFCIVARFRDVCEIDIEESIAVAVGDANAHAVINILQAELRRFFLKRLVAVVQIELVPAKVIGQIEIQQAVVIGVEGHARPGQASVGQAACLGDIQERPIAEVFLQPVSWIAGSVLPVAHIQI